MARTPAPGVWYVDADHRGAALLRQLVLVLERTGDRVVDIGARLRHPDDDYPQAAARVVRAVRGRPYAFGLLLCGSGNGVAMAANRARGIRAALAPSPRYAVHARRDEDANVLVLPARWMTASAARPILAAWRATRPSRAARHMRRRAQLDRLL